MGSFLSNVFGNLLADAIVAALAGGGVIAWMKRHGSPWLVPILWGLGGSVGILIGAGAIRLIAFPVPQPATQITSDNVERNVKNWLERFGFSIQKMPVSDGRYFQYVATNPFNRKTVVERVKSVPLDSYLEFENSVILGAEDPARFNTLSATNKSKFILDLTAEMARAKIGFSTVYSPQFQIQLSKTLPIASGLTEATFIQTMSDMDSGQLLVLAAIPLELSEFSKLR